MSKFPDPPTYTDFSDKTQPAPSDPWEKWFIAVGNGITNSSQGFNVTHANRLKLTNVSLGSLAYETDTGHVFAWFNKWVQLI